MIENSLVTSITEWQCSPENNRKIMTNNNRFVFIIPCFNAKDTIVQMMLSVIAQTHGNWKMVIRDDMSTDGTPEIIKAFSSHMNIQEKVSLTVNTEKMWEVRNILEALKECEEDDIVCRLDGDDWLCDLDVLTIINHRYATMDIDALWTAHRWGFQNYNISSELPEGADVYKHPWVSSHLKTFRKSLVSNVKDENFRNKDGEYFKRIGDQAVYLPVLHNSKKWHFEPIVAYHYTIDVKPETFQSDDAKFQKSEGEYLRARGFLS